MAHSNGLCWTLIAFAGLASPAVADPIRYTTAGGSNAQVTFEGTSGTFEPGSTISLGRLVINAPAPGGSLSLKDQSFVIALRTPDFDVPVPAGTEAAYPTTVESSVLVGGKLSTVLKDGVPELVATYNPVQLGGLGPYLLGHVQRFTFPIPAADVKIPAEQHFALPADGGTGSSPLYLELTAQIVPEPAAGAGWALALLAGFATRRTLASRRGRHPAS